MSVMMCGDWGRHCAAAEARSGPGSAPSPSGNESRGRETDPSPSSAAALTHVPSRRAAKPRSALRSDVAPSLARCVFGPAPRRCQGDGASPPPSGAAHAWPHAQCRRLPRPTSPRPQGNGRMAMTSRRPGRASRTLEMEEKEHLRRQIRLLQGEPGRGRASLSGPSPHEGGGSLPAVWTARAGRARRRAAGEGGGRGAASGRSFRRRREAAPAPGAGQRGGSFGARGAFLPPTPPVPALGLGTASRRDIPGPDS